MSLRGESILQFGLQANHGFRCSVGDDGNLQIHVRLEDVIQIETPHASGSLDRSEYAGSYDDPEAEYENDPYNENSGYISTRIPVMVELGRIEVTTRELLQYQLGKVIPLGRSPYDPFDLYVKNKHVGQAVLEEVDGQLGIKIEDFYW